MAGVMCANAPPETPFLTSKGGALVNQTPVIKRFNVLRPVTGAGSNNIATGGVVFNRLEYNRIPEQENQTRHVREMISTSSNEESKGEPRS